MSSEPDKVKARLRRLFSAHRDEQPAPDAAPEPRSQAIAAGRDGGGESKPHEQRTVEASAPLLGPSRLSAARPRRRKPVQLTLAQLEGIPNEEETDTLRIVRFRLGDAEFAVALSAVREVQRMGPLTPVPGGSPSLLGLMNLRGAVVPVFDIRRVLCGARMAPGALARVLVFGSAEATSLGIVVDGIQGTDRVHVPLAEPAPADALPLVEGNGQTANGQWVTVLSAARLLEIGAQY